MKYFKVLFIFMLLSTYAENTVAQTQRKTGQRDYRSAASPGDLIEYTFDWDNFYYSAHNITTGLNASGRFTKWEDESFDAGIYEFVNSNGYLHFAVELNNKLLATNFPGGTQKVSISSGVSMDVVNRNNIDQFDGDYVYFILNLDGNRDMDWGLAVFKENEWAMINYNTASILPDVLTAEDIDNSLENLEYGTYELNPNNANSFNLYIDDYAYEGMGYANVNEALMIIDLGVGNGFFQAIKIPDEDVSFEQLAGTYNYIEADVDFGSGAGMFVIDEEGRFYRYHVDENGHEYGFNQDDELLEVGQLSAGNIPNIFYSDGTETESSIFYFIIAGDLIMYFTIDELGLMNYGIGNRLD